MAVIAADSSSFSVLLKKPDANLDAVPKNSTGFVTFSCFSSSPCSVLSLSSNGGRRRVVRCASTVDEENLVVSSGVLFQPFEELKKEEFMVPISPLTSLARQRYFEECESAINEQIKVRLVYGNGLDFNKPYKYFTNMPHVLSLVIIIKHESVEYNVSYAYHSMYAYFDRDNIALKGLAKFFKESSDEEREHAETLMKFQNTRGGRVKLHTIVGPPSEFEHVEKGDALYAMEVALSLEKLTNAKLLYLHEVACINNDPQMADFIETQFLTEQVEAIKKIADYVSQLRTVGKGHGVWHFDQMLLGEGA